jgi:hypothetical protein
MKINLEIFDYRQIERLLDLFKFLSNLKSEEVKRKLELRLK